MSEWTVYRDGVEESDVNDVRVIETANPFGSHAIIKMDDFEGGKFDYYDRSTRVGLDVTPVGGGDLPPDLQVDSGTTHTVEPGGTPTYGTVDVQGTLNVDGTLNVQGADTGKRFVGYAVEAREGDRQGADSLEVECYTFDQFLRGETVTNDQSGKTITAALQDIVETDTPISWVAGNVDVGDPQTLTQSFRGDKVENAIREIAFKSENEQFGVNDSLEFYFNPQEESRAPRDIAPSEVFNYDIPRLGKSAVNEVKVWFNGGDESVVVEANEDALNRQDSLGTVDPVKDVEEVSREELTDIEDARSVGEQILEFRNETLSGTVTTYGLFEASPGDVIGIEIPSRGIDGDFRIAEIEYHWGRDETTLTIVEKRGDQDALLVRMSDTLKRVEKRQANPDAIENRVTSTAMGAMIDVGGGLSDGSNDFAATRFVNAGANRVRDAWIDGGGLDVAEMAVGDDAGNLSRANTALENETERVSVTPTTVGSYSVEFDASFTATGVSEAAVFAASGEMIARAVFDSPVDAPSLTVSFTVGNDTEFSKGVLTNHGQTQVRDVLATNSPATPTEYAYGTAGTDPQESDTSLGAQETVVGLDEVLMQNATANDEWSDLVGSIPDDAPVAIQNGRLELLQSSDTRDALRDNDGETGSPGFDDDNAYNDSQAILIQGGATVEFQVQFGYRIPEEHVGIQVRDYIPDDGNTVDLEYRWDGEFVDGSSQSQSILLGWHDIGNGFYSAGAGYQHGDIQPGTTHILRVVNNSGASYILDVVQVYDKRYSYTRPNPDAATNGGGILDGPELYPGAHAVTFKQSQARRNVDSARFNTVWNDVSNGQKMEVSNDGGANFKMVSNTQSGEVLFQTDGQEVVSRVTLSRYGTDSTVIPTSGDTGQYIDTWELYTDVSSLTAAGIGLVDARGIVPRGTISGVEIQEGGQLDTNNNLLTRAVFPPVDFTVDNADRIRLQSSERIEFGDK